MRVGLDTVKRAKTLHERNLDLANFADLFSGTYVAFEDADRSDGEARRVILGTLGRRLIVAAYTMHGKIHRVLSMRKTSEREKKLYQKATAPDRRRG